MNGLVDPLGDGEEAKLRRAEAMFGVQLGDPAPQSITFQPMGGLLGRASPAPDVQGLLGEAPEQPNGFWRGGKKFTGRDALAGLLAVIGDAAAQHSGGNASAVAALTGQRSKGIEALEEAQKVYRRKQQLAALPGMTARELLAYSADPKAWGGHMADAIATHHAAANVNPGEQRVFGNPNAGGTLYQAPTAAEQYAASLGNQAGTPEHRTALQDYVLRGNGPTAIDLDTALDDHRTGNKRGLENQRQANRLQLRGTPTAPRTVGSRPSAPRRKANPTATGRNGEKYEYNGKAWVRIN